MCLSTTHFDCQCGIRKNVDDVSAGAIYTVIWEGGYGDKQSLNEVRENKTDRFCFIKY